MYSVYSNHKRSRVPYFPGRSTHSTRRPGTAREYLQPHKTMLKIQPGRCSSIVSRWHTSVP
ncbi:hypothetical protein BGW80DRAFT_1302358 [Lactifluus volemus]|nr:hypothetical protein BGW80DRAFT_1302358 [Lactifluus volemus]